MAYPQLVQPVLKSDLHEHKGNLTVAAWLDVETRLRLLFGFPAPLGALPPR